MRPVLLLSAILALGCALGNKQSEACDAYLDCLEEADPTTFEASEPAYGHGGSCWEGDPDACDQTCRSALDLAADLWPEVDACGVEVEGGSFFPRMGVYEMSPAGSATSDSCGVGSVDDTTLELTQSGTGFLVEADGDVLTCTLEDHEFACAYSEREQACDVRIAIDGTFSGETHFDGVFELSLECDSGDACDFAQPVAADRLD